MRRGSELLRELCSPKVKQDEVAEALNCTQQAVSSWISGKRPSLDRALKLQRLYGIPVESWSDEDMADPDEDVSAPGDAAE